MQRFTATVVASAGGNTYSPVYVVDRYANPCDVAIGITNVIGAPGYTVQHCFDDPFLVNLNIPTNGSWNNNQYLVNASAAGDTNYAFPPTAVRVLVSANSSAQLTMNILQAGPR